MLTPIKNQLLDCISALVSDSRDLISDLNAFSRTSTLDFGTMLYAILAMGGASLSKEL